MQLIVVRHGRTRPDLAVPAPEWPVHDDTMPDHVLAVTEPCPRWTSSPERKAVGTAAALTSEDITLDERLREVDRGAWIDDYVGAVEQHLTQLERSAADGWETGTSVRARLYDWLCDLDPTVSPLG